MEKIKWYLFWGVLCIFCGQGSGLAETMYVTDRLHLSLRSAPDSDEPSVTVISSDTKVEVLETEDKWAKIMLENGRTGWVLKKYLVSNLRKSPVIEDLERKIEEKDRTLEGLQEENASLKEQISGLETLKARETVLNKEIEDLRKKVVQQSKSLEAAKERKSFFKRKEVYGTGIVALALGLIVGYLVRRPDKNRFYLR